MLGGPRVQAGRKRANQRPELRRLLRSPRRRLLRNAVGAHPAIARQVGIAVELGAAAARLRVEAHEQLGMRFHLRVPVRVEEARVIGREDVRDAVAVPENLRPLFRNGSRAGHGGQRDERDAQPERRARPDSKALLEVFHRATIHRSCSG